MPTFSPGLKVKDGFFGRKGIEHSWLLTGIPSFATPEGNILDIYPSGQVGGPMLVWNGLRSPWAPFYMEHPIKIVTRAEFEYWCAYIKKAIRRKAETLKFIEAAE